MAENLYKRQTAGDAKWLSTLARLNRRGGHGDISNEVVIGDDWKEAIAKLLWALSQLQRGCQNPVLGLRAQCWAPEIGETFSGLNPLIPSNETNELLKPNHTYYVRTRRGTAITLWLPDATDSDGEVIEVKDADGSADTKNITIKTTKGQTIDGASTFTISASYGSAQIRSNGQQWYTVARKNASEGLTGLEVTQTTASTADNLLYRTDRPSSDNRVAQTTGITCDDSNNLSGIGTIGSGAITSSGFIKSTSSSAGVGYATGAGGTVTQLTSKSTAVTLDKICGDITMHNAALAAGATVSFAVNNSVLDGTEFVMVQHTSGGSSGSYAVEAYRTGVGGLFGVNVTNITTGSLSEAIVIRFIALKGATA